MGAKRLHELPVSYKCLDLSDTLVSPLPFIMHSEPSKLWEEVREYKINIFNWVKDLTMVITIKIQLLPTK